MRRSVLTAVLLGGFSNFLIFQAHAIIDASLQMQLGNPSGALVDTNNHDHYLIQRTVEAIDYSDNLGEPVWASWDLTADDVGGSGRSTTYVTDTNLPPDFYHVTTTDYNGVGNIDFNRGHLCPSADRTDTTNDNKLVFFMSNIMPQSGPNNQGVWGNFEDYCRSLLSTNELLITCEPSGFGTRTIPSGKAFIGSNTWKVVVCIPLGSGTAATRITTATRVIAISVPNVTNGLSSAWQTYLTSPHQIEQDTGFTFFTALNPNLASILRAKVDGVAPPAMTPPEFQSISFANGQISLVVTGAVATYTISATTNLANPQWDTLLTTNYPDLPLTFMDTNINLPQRFYRVQTAP
jgi:DNA/RNA endonuclease G (NUC1)